MIVILYTTRYRTGGHEMELAARHLAMQKRDENPERPIMLRAVESKAAFLEALADVPAAITEFHLIGHSGLYGPMFGTTSHPDQMSRHEWNELEIPFAAGASAWFHCCRSGRWFAQFFARRYRVPTYGNHSYTTFSHSPDVYQEVAGGSDRSDIYVVSVPGFKGMGVAGALRKRLGRCRTIPMERFEPAPIDGDPTYNGVAELYDAVFDDFQVRADEWRWLARQLPERPAVLDIGCGNGALLRALAPLVQSGVGVDTSEAMIEVASRRSSHEPMLHFREIAGPTLPFPDASFDLVVSMLSWRYLDWDPITAEIKRILRPGGRLLIVDMAVTPFRWRRVPKMLGDRMRALVHAAGRPNFRRSLRRMVEDPAWKGMLRHNPMRAQHEYRWYLPSRFPGGEIETLNLTPRSEMIAFRWDAP